ncbi:hypothetical protein BJ085DRAFT_39512 [Dimargaris cristalligena]|uniref:Uncharacterized protein n=1 Tax=Dimargaris cristalligena TaxID=215637 RepID=A0A4Q0A3U6_9FUNG|nr:hypothetical protein BJ085DRAFT_39512 [Dimargaris cristalligena]|eukprot:RKP40251.1 hypothetical protein BJ085DRAFT_39512 [Dimargaris cristalligena]
MRRITHHTISYVVSPNEQFPTPPWSRPHSLMEWLLGPASPSQSAISYRLPNSRKMQFKFASVALLAIALTLSVVRAQDDTFDDSSPLVGDYEPADDDYNNYVERRAWFDGHDDRFHSYGYLVRRDFDGGYSGGHGGAGSASGYGGAGGLGGFGYIPSIRATNSRTNAKVLKNQKLAFAKLKNKKIKADSKLAVKA